MITLAPPFQIIFPESDFRPFRFIFNEKEVTAKKCALGNSPSRRDPLTRQLSHRSGGISSRSFPGPHHICLCRLDSGLFLMKIQASPDCLRKEIGLILKNNYGVFSHLMATWQKP